MTTPDHTSIPALARRLTKPQRKVLAEVPAGLLRRDRYSCTGRAYVAGWYPSAVTNTARSLARAGLVDTPSPYARSPEGQRAPSYTLTELGRAVLDHLTTERAS